MFFYKSTKNEKITLAEEIKLVITDEAAAEKLSFYFETITGSEFAKQS